MTLFLGSLQLGLLYGILAIGIYISFRILNVPDLTTEGSFTFGLATSAMCAIAGHYVLGIILSIFAGALAGIITGFLQTKCRIHPILSGIITMSGLYTVNLAVMKNAVNVSLIGKDEIFTTFINALEGMSKDSVKCIVSFIFAAVVCVLIILFFKTHLGLCIRATGDNEAMVSSSSINVDATKVISLAISNGCVGLSGGLLAQYQGFADVNMGRGSIVIGLAAVIIGEAIFSRIFRNFALKLLSVVFGSILYYLVLQIVIWMGIDTDLLKMLSALIVALFLAFPYWKSKYFTKAKQGGK